MQRGYKKLAGVILCGTTAFSDLCNGITRPGRALAQLCEKISGCLGVY